MHARRKLLRPQVREARYASGEGEANVRDLLHTPDVRRAGLRDGVRRLRDFDPLRAMPNDHHHDHDHHNDHDEQPLWRDMPLPSVMS